MDIKENCKEADIKVTWDILSSYIQRVLEI